MKLQTVHRLMQILTGAAVTAAVFSWLGESIVFLIFMWILIIACVVLDWVFWRCPYCGRYLGRKNVRFCPHCGNELSGK